MAIVSAIAGSVVGFVTFIYSLFVLDYSLTSAMGLYIAIGLILSSSLIFLAFCARWVTQAITAQDTLAATPVRAPVTYYKK